MRILVVDQFSRNVGHDTFMLAKRINDLGNEVEVACTDDYKFGTFGLKKHVCFINVYKGNFIKKIVNYLKSLKRLKKIIKEGKYDAVNFQWFSLPWIETRFVKSIHKYAKTFITIHDVVPLRVRPFEMKALNSIYSNVDGLFIQNEYAEKIYLENFENKTPYQIVTSAFCDKFEFEPISKKEARNQLGIPEDKFVYLYYGTIRDSKGLPDLFNAFREVSKAKKNSFLLVGGAFSHVDENAYHELVKKNTNSDNARIDFKFIDPEDEKKYFCAADCVCLPYLVGFQSGVAQLGLMYDLPLITSNIGDLPNCVINGENGFVYEAGNKEQLAKAMIDIVDCDLSAFSEKSKQLSLTKFSLSKKAELFVEFYNKIVDKKDD